MTRLRVAHCCAPDTPLHVAPQVALALYPFLWFQLYYSLIKQRGKRLGSRAAAGAKKQQ